MKVAWASGSFGHLGGEGGVWYLGYGPHAMLTELTAVPAAAIDHLC